MSLLAYLNTGQFNVGLRVHFGLEWSTDFVPDIDKLTAIDWRHVAYGLWPVKRTGEVHFQMMHVQTRAGEGMSEGPSVAIEVRKVSCFSESDISLHKSQDSCCKHCKRQIDIFYTYSSTVPTETVIDQMLSPLTKFGLDFH